MWNHSRKETQNSVFSERISPAVKELISLMRGFYKVQQFYIKHRVTPDESPSKHNFQFFQQHSQKEMHFGGFTFLFFTYSIKSYADHALIQRCSLSSQVFSLIQATWASFLKQGQKQHLKKHCGRRNTISAGSTAWWQAHSPRTSLWKQSMGTIKMK